jgi:hypothetical protein
MTIDQQDNYGRQAKGYLPTLVVRGQQNPVVKIVDEADGSWVYALRIAGTEFRPKVFKKGSYTIEVGEGDAKKIVRGVKSIGANQVRRLEIVF